jgi:hypothetical protein
MPRLTPTDVYFEFRLAFSDLPDVRLALRDRVGARGGLLVVAMPPAGRFVQAPVPQHAISWGRRGEVAALAEIARSYVEQLPDEPDSIDGVVVLR